jgi:hypothetical protein
MRLLRGCGETQSIFQRGRLPLLRGYCEGGGALCGALGALGGAGERESEPNANPSSVSSSSGSGSAAFLA